MSASQPSPARPQVMVCFDFEGRWGMPQAAPYDLERGAEAILETLAKHNVRAVFFTVGELATSHPRVIRAIAAGGHEVALHGWRHESLEELPASELTTVATGLKRARTQIGEETGMAPVGFRAPYLLGPHFYRREVYEMLERLGFRWVSNRHLRFPIELVKPDHLPSARRLWRRPGVQRRLTDSSTSLWLLVALNLGLCLRDRVAGSVPATVRWLTAGAEPFVRGGLLEIPVTGPLDCDLLGFPLPAQPTTEELMSFAGMAIESHLTSLRPMQMLTFHDWLVNGSNRPALLDHCLSVIVRERLQVVLGKDFPT